MKNIKNRFFFSFLFPQFLLKKKIARPMSFENLLTFPIIKLGGKKLLKAILASFNFYYRSV